MKIALTGHRPADLPKDETYLRGNLDKLYNSLCPDVVITGMADGFDLIGGCLALDHNIPVICAVPYWEHIKSNNPAYKRLLNRAKEIVVVTPGPYHVYKLHKRNEWMVDNSDLVISAWNGKESGGTFACMEYARKVDRALVNINLNDNGWEVLNSWPGRDKLLDELGDK